MKAATSNTNSARNTGRMLLASVKHCKCMSYNIYRSGQTYQFLFKFWKLHLTYSSIQVLQRNDHWSYEFEWSLKYAGQFSWHQVILILCVSENQIQMVQAKLTQDTNAFDGDLGESINKRRLRIQWILSIENQLGICTSCGL